MSLRKPTVSLRQARRDLSIGTLFVVSTPREGCFNILPASWLTMPGARAYRLPSFSLTSRMPTHFPHSAGWIFPITCIVLYRTCIVLYRTCIHKCIHRAYVCSIHFDTHSIRNLGFGGRSAVYRALDTEPISVIFVSFMYRVYIEKFRRKCIVFCIVICIVHTFDQYRKRIENDVSSFCIVFVSSMYLTCTRFPNLLIAWPRIVRVSVKCIVVYVS